MLDAGRVIFTKGSRLDYHRSFAHLGARGVGNRMWQSAVQDDPEKVVAVRFAPLSTTSPCKGRSRSSSSSSSSSSSRSRSRCGGGGGGGRVSDLSSSTLLCNQVFRGIRTAPPSAWCPSSPPTTKRCQPPSTFGRLGRTAVGRLEQASPVGQPRAPWHGVA